MRLILDLCVGGESVSVDKRSVIHPTPSHPPTPRRCRSVGWKTAKPFPRVTSRLLASRLPRLSAAVAGHGGSSLSVVLVGGPYRWISEALSTLRDLTRPHRPHRRRIDVAGGRVENGGAFSTRHSQATSLSPFFPSEWVDVTDKQEDRFRDYAS